MEKSVEIQKLLDIVQEYQSLNPDLILSGSLGLLIQDIELNRLPHDIDFYSLNVGRIIHPEGYSDITDYDDTDYPEGDYDMFIFKYKDIKLNIFQYNGKNLPLFKSYHHDNKIKVLRKIEIINFKVLHSLDMIPSSIKHQEDLIFLFNWLKAKTNLRMLLKLKDEF